MSTQRQQVVGNFATAKLLSTIGVSDLTFSVQAGQGANAPSGPTNFIMSLERQSGGEEKILCSARSGDTFTVAASGRGYDGTAAVGHQAGVTVDHVASGSAIDTHDAHVFDGTRDDHTSYLRTDATRASTGTQVFPAASFTGLPNAVAGGRIVGATVGAAPSAGAWLIGDTVIDRTGGFWICTVAGTPGTWLWVSTPLTTKGDLLGFGTALARVPVGADGTALISDSSQALGVRWASGMVKIAETTLGSDAANIDFTSIPSTYLDLIVRGVLRTAGAGTADNVYVQVNGDTAVGNYVFEQLTCTATTATAAEGIGTNAGLKLGECAGNTAPANVFSPVEMTIPEYSGTTHLKTAQSRTHNARALTTGNVALGLYVGTWNNTAAINRLTIVAAGGSLKAGSRLSLYGLKAGT